MDIEKAVQEKFYVIAQSGVIEEAIKEQLEKSIKSMISDCLKEYSDFGKTIKKKIKESLNLGNMDLDLPSYNQLVCNWVTEIVNQQIITDSKAQIQKNIKMFFKPLKKLEYKISEIIEKFKELIYEPDDYNITFIADAPSTGIAPGYLHFYFDEKPNREKFSCDYKFGLTPEGELFTVTISGVDGNKIKFDPGYGFDSFLFQLFAAKIKIIDDSEDVDIHFEKEY